MMNTFLGKPLSSGGGGAKIGVTLNEDDTQNLFITDNNTVLNLLVGTEDATATSADVASGKTFYAQGRKKTGTAVSYEPVLLWTNPDRTKTFAAKTLTVESGYSAYLIEIWPWTNSLSSASLEITYVPFGTNRTAYGGRASNYREISEAIDGSIVFGNGHSAGQDASGKWAVPTRIWGVKFTLN